MKLEKVGMSQNCWDKSWDFQHFSWEIQRLGSSNTEEDTCGGNDWCNLVNFGCIWSHMFRSGGPKPENNLCWL